MKKSIPHDVKARPRHERLRALEPKSSLQEPQ
jgi:hypothetical protein